MKSCQIFWFFLLIKSVQVFLGGALASSGLPRSADEAGFGHLTAVRLFQTRTRSTTHNEALPRRCLTCIGPWQTGCSAPD